MITIEQAIELATKAHEGQWRHTETIDKESLSLYYDLGKDTLFPYFLPNGNKIFILDGKLVMQKLYITHPLAVMEMMGTIEEKIVAVLHDVFEDTEARLHLNFNSIASTIVYKENEYTIPTTTIAIPLCALTKPNNDLGKFKEKGHYQSYQGYIKDLTLNRIATKVKISDIVHNLSCSPSDHAKQKYLKAIPVLLKSF